MICRRNEINNKTTNIVWFSSYGVDELGHALFYGVEHTYYLNAIIKKEIDELPARGDYDVCYILNNVNYFWTKDGFKSENNLNIKYKNLKIFNTIEEYDNFIKTINRSNNYSKAQEGVKDSLIQRLSVLKKELWYNPNYGLPLIDKVRNKGIYDAIALDIITSHPDVRNVVKFESQVESHKYSLSFVVTTIYTSDETKIELNL